MYHKNNILRNCLLLLVFGIALTALSSVSYAAVYYVSPSGSASWSACNNINTPCSWQTAMSNAVADDIVYFRGGTYNVEASCSGSWEYIAMKPTHGGTAGHPITFIAYPGETPIVTPCTASPKSPAFGARDVDYIIWDGFSGTMIDGAGEIWYFLYWNSNNSIVRNMTFLGQQTHSDYHNCAPISIVYSSDVEVYNNNLRCVGGSTVTNSACIWLFTAVKTLIHQNTMHDGGHGVMQKLGANIDNEIYKNFIYNMTSDGVMLNEQASGGSGNKVYQNVLVNVSNNAINVYPGGVGSNYQTNYQIYNNTIYGSGTGIQVSDMARNNQIWNNIISGSSQPFLRYYSGDSLPSYSDYNDFYGSGYWNLNWTNNYNSLSAWRTATSLDTNSITTNPNFVNAGGSNPSDYKLVAGSPALTGGRGGSYPSVMGAYITGNERIGYLSPPENLIEATLFNENFEDGNFASRGWYDNTTLKLSTTEHIPGSTRSVEYHFLPGATTPEVSGGTIRKKFTETDAVYISYYVKHSANWVGSNLSYHPHEFLILTNLDGDWTGPSETHLTTYIEENGGKPILGLQDALNIDETNIGVDLTSITEQRAVAGCNGFSQADGSDPEDCYLARPGIHRNWKTWRTSNLYFQDSPGPYYKGDWHHVEAYFKLNSIVNGEGVADGMLQYWYDGILIVDHNNVLFHTGQYPDMKFNQFMIAPYIGDGSPVDQTMWVDDLTVGNARLDSTVPSSPHLNTPQ
jgi:hypothetical protein